MFLRGFVRNIEPIEFLTDAEVVRIHQRSLEVLEETGVTFDHQRALHIFDEAGCQVDRDKKRVRIQSSLVEECLRKCPKCFTVKSRDPKNTLNIGENRLYASGGCGLDILDLDTGERRKPTREDEVDAVKICDALENIHFLDYGPYCNFEGIHPNLSLIWAFATQVRNSTKVVFSASAARSEKWNIEIAKATNQEAVGIVSASPPLTFYSGAIDAAFELAEAGFPIMIDTGPVFGASAPATLVGTMVIANTELLAVAVLLQLVKPKTRLVAHIFPHPMEMRSGIPLFGALERAIVFAMFNQIWRRYGVPTQTDACYTSGKLIDYQAGYEKSMQFLLEALSGSHMIFSGGGVFGELTIHPVMSVIDNDIHGIVGRVLEGVEVSDETMAIDLIKQVGPIPGHFLDKEHTRTWWKKEVYLPKVADRLPYSEWIDKGKSDIITNAKERVKDILATHEPTPLPKDQDKEIDQILEQAKNYYKEKGMW